MDKLSRWIRVATAAPILAGCMLVVLYCCRPERIGGAPPLQWGLLCLTVLPLLAYPLQRYIPGFRGRGREGQRSLAMVFAVIGYLLGCVGNALLRGTRAMWIVYTEYLLSGLLLLAVNKLIGKKASGHACGAAGPVALLCYFGVPALLPGAVLLVLVWWASLHTGRHTSAQLAGGTAVPLAALLLIHLLSPLL